MAQGVDEAEGALYVLLFKEASSLYEILYIGEGEDSSTVLELKSDQPSGGFCVSADDYWIAQNSHSIYRIDRKEGTIHHYSLPGAERAIKDILVSPQGKVWLPIYLKLPASASGAPP
ncbi:MAG: hypothetical protein H6563_14020 [Lewinellaceae bacterium]|nr:hypothetical protein [Lewinellaceae bacterium]